MSPPYTTVQSLGKAAARARKLLPQCPEKRKVVLKKLLLEVEETNEASCSLNFIKKEHRGSLKSEVVTAIKEFYFREDISRQAPGLKDFITVRKIGKPKEKMQIRHLCTSISETHALFVREYGEIVGKSKFAEYRPKNIFLSSQLPHSVCLCRYHENYILALNAIHGISPECPRYNHDFIESVICENPTKECWLFTCDVCKDILDSNLEQYVNACKNSEVSWMVWQDSEGKLCKVLHSGSALELRKHILGMSRTFFEHCYAKRNQAVAYQNDRTAISATSFDPSAALVQVDFSENFTCIAQDEVQSFHWAQPQVTFFTVSAWFMSKQHPIVIVSDNRNHNKETVAIYMDRVIKELPPCITKVYIWSDGPASQFKNRYIVETIKIIQQRNKKDIIWNYFATSHGKSPVDGIGGALKRLVRNKVMRREAIVINAEQFAKAAESSKVKVINITPKEIEDVAKEMNLLANFDQAASIPGLSKVHVICFQNGILKKGHITSDLQVGIKVIGENNYFSDEDDEIPLATLKKRLLATSDALTV